MTFLWIWCYNVETAPYAPCSCLYPQSLVHYLAHNRCWVRSAELNLSIVRSRNPLLDKEISVGVPGVLLYSSQPLSGEQTSCSLFKTPPHFCCYHPGPPTCHHLLPGSCNSLSPNWYSCFCLLLAIQSRSSSQNNLWTLKSDLITSLLKILQWLLTTLGIKPKLVLPTFIAFTTTKTILSSYSLTPSSRMSCYRRAGAVSVVPVLGMVPAT